MKTLSDGTEIPSRIYYYLLDWNEQDCHKTKADRFHKERQCDLTKEEFYLLFSIAAKQDCSDFLVNLNQN